MKRVTIGIVSALLCLSGVFHVFTSSVSAQPGETDTGETEAGGQITRAAVAESNFAGSRELSLRDRWIASGFWCDRSVVTLEKTSAETLAPEATEVEQTIIGAWGRYYFSPAIDARFELSGQQATSTNGELTFGDGFSGALLLRYQRPGQRWLVQGGLGLPAGGELSAEQRSLSSWLSDPLLGFSTQNLSRGWSFHIGAMGAYPLRRDCSLYVGAGFKALTAYEPVGGVTISPGNRTSLLGGIEMNRWLRPDINWGAEVAVDLVGEESTDAAVIRGSQKLTSIRLFCSAGFGPVALRFAAAMSSVDAYDWLSATGVADYLSAGPGKLTVAEITLAPVRRFHTGETIYFSPSLTVGMRQFDPGGLPYGDGSALTITPGIVLGGFGPLVTISYGLGSGSWLDPELADYEPDLSKTTLRAAVTWLPDTDADNETPIKR